MLIYGDAKYNNVFYSRGALFGILASLFFPLLILTNFMLAQVEQTLNEK
jgi:hypothetical protein